jgi:hypothetical protein
MNLLDSSTMGDVGSMNLLALCLRATCSKDVV